MINLSFTYLDFWIVIYDFDSKISFTKLEVSEKFFNPDIFLYISFATAVEITRASVLGYVTSFFWKYPEPAENYTY